MLMLWLWCSFVAVAALGSDRFDVLFNFIFNLLGKSKASL